MKKLNDVEAWDVMRGMVCPWTICEKGTATQNAKMLQNWFESRNYFVSLKNCRKCAAEVKRYNKQ